MSTSLKTLISKLNSTCRQAAEQAVSRCRARGHFEVEVEHLLLALLEQRHSDVSVIVKRSGLSQETLESELSKELDTLREGSTRTPVFSTQLPVWLESAWLIASLEAQDGAIRSGHLLLALLTQPALAQRATRSSTILAKLSPEDLKAHFDRFTEGSQELDHVSDVACIPGADEGVTVQVKTPALDQFTTSLTQRARDGHLDPVIGREMEIRQVIDILMRRQQNNPILTGEAGVGKTAVAEGLAHAIVSEDVPSALVGVELLALDMGLLQAGASVKGEFELRLKNVIEEVKKHPIPIILFIDEAHTLIGAGGTAGQNDAANLLKPALARGELRTLAATTWSEYKKYFEKDAALTRRFQMVKVDEPSESVAAAMLRALVPLMEQHFNVRVLDEAVTEAVRLSHRYISARQLPDKAVSVLDTACSRVALSQGVRPAMIADLQKQLEQLEVQRQALSRELASGGQHEKHLNELQAHSATLTQQLDEATTLWQQESVLVQRIAQLRGELEEEMPSANALTAARKKAPMPPQRLELARAMDALAKVQGETPLLPLQVDANVIAQVVSAWTGIPLGKMVKDEIRTVRTLGDVLQARVIGQPHALASIAQRVRTARAYLEDPDKPRGVFLFVGPSGVGKTETALALADALYGGERKLITFNMSEYQEAHSVSGLKGSPPGYVGYGEGGQLTEAVRRAPYSVVLLDEVEKAHPDVLELFYQVFDKGVLDDAEGREIDFRNTLIILTSNTASSLIMQACLNKTPDELPGVKQLSELIRPTLYKTFKPAFLGRMDVVPYYPINDDSLAAIIRLKLDRVGRRVEANHQAEFHYDDALVESLLVRCTEVDIGARAVDQIINGSLLPEIADAVLARMADGQALSRIKVGANKRGFTYQIK
ncbi:type VI secretion system ATPase TssH [Pseudomonas paralactis]|uniref:type VI secretion system ATPase TssH n=1 Tax=Pseudomonas paralactis TaxID=1615673 RepID=UPI001647D81C|nr:type VI secretion system ATPase TssH [Pseudomonas paralactis]MBC3256735.1 type VI secretion system ATPase TssH [Pseudomonas paralactis]